MSCIRAAILLSIFLISTQAFPQTGTITGFVSDSKTGEPLAGVNILVNELKNTGAVTDADGRFIMIVPLGSYSLKASAVGFRPVVRTDVIVTAGARLMWH